MNQASTHHDTDEIDLINLFRYFWKGRLIIILSVIVGILVSGAVYFSAKLSQPSLNASHIELRFNFPSIQNGSYPNEQRFSLNDIIAPSILNQVYGEYNLADYGLSRSEFIKAIQITPFATNRQFIEARFKNALDNKKLSVAEIDELNANYSQALEAANRRFAKLTFTTQADLIIPQEVINNILTAIPASWSKESIENYGVLDIAASSITPLDKSLIESYEYLISAEYLADHLESILNSVNALMSDSIGSLLVDPESGLTIFNVSEELTNLKQFHVDTLRQSFSVTPTVRQESETIFYLGNKIISEKERLNVLERKAAIIDNAYVQLSQNHRQTNVNADLIGRGEANYTAQYGDELLTRLMSIGDELSDAKFKQSLLDRSIALKLEAEDSNATIIRLEQNLAALKDNNEGGGNILAKERVDMEMKYISDKLESMSAVVNRLADLRSQRILGQSGTLYELNSEPVKAGSFRTELKNLVKYLLIGSVASLFIGMFIALMVALIRSSRQSS